MGRRPNPLVTEFFTRGPKLPDSSNRYEHTCKLCGENFPKGRADTLLSHLTKTCQAIPAADKERVVQQTRINPAKGAKKGQTNARVERGKVANFPYPTPRNGAFNSLGGINGLNGLNVLAEASRRVGATDDKQPGDPMQDITFGDNKNVLVDPALENSFKHTLDTDFHAAFGPSPSPTTQFFSATTEPSLSIHLAPTSLPDSLTDVRQSSQLSLIAASANEMVTHDGTGPSNAVDNGSDFDAELPCSSQRAALFPRPIAMNPNRQGNSTPPQSTENTPTTSRQRIRSAFTEVRRREVQDVRKIGACLRCRILKKTCSIGKPCDQCKNLQNPRVWSEYCTRERLSAQLGSYTAGLHSTLTYHETNRFKNHMQFEHTVGRIEITHFDSEPPSILTFGVLHGQRPVATGVESQLPISESHGGLDVHMQDVYLLDGDSEEWGTKLEFYMKRMAQQFFASETTDFVRHAVTLAWNLGQNQENDILNDALQLWVATCILADPTLNWNVFYNPTLPPTTLHPLASTSNESRIPVDHLNDFETFNVICNQVRAAVEKRAAKIGKALMTKVEDHMLKKGSAGRLSTFLATLILLNCAERMSWLFSTWDNDHSTHRWPLERRPADFGAEAEKFAGFVSSHLNMRKKARIYTADTETGLFRGSDGCDPAAVQLFNAVNLTSDYLEERRSAAFDPTDMRSFDLKYCSRLF